MCGRVRVGVLGIGRGSARAGDIALPVLSPRPLGFNPTDTGTDNFCWLDLCLVGPGVEGSVRRHGD
jgi:hypothetical protein